ncbi:hypothetical protein SLEP1_g33765 [Rubroshorea leprosula]|uniref:Uncharacterized protein n=1 Tax=Rubroshorea leprosula TaxID=152421 RepID=A0AAV5KHN7_9ROSI|nr:hypothetical protein SLEP1_g33765 [Rubroshorea leprosula]
MIYAFHFLTLCIEILLKAQYHQVCQIMLVIQMMGMVYLNHQNCQVMLVIQMMRMVYLLDTINPFPTL